MNGQVSKDPLSVVQKEVRPLFENGFLYHLPEPKPKVLGRGRKKQGGGTNYNAKYISSINQGGRFTLK